MRTAILSIACVVGLGFSAGSAKAGGFDIVVKFPSWGYTYVSPYASYYSYPSIYAPYYPPTVIQTAPIIVARPTYVPYYSPVRTYYPPVTTFPSGHHHHRR